MNVVFKFTQDEIKLIATALYFYQESGTILDTKELDLLYKVLSVFNKYDDAGKGYSWNNGGLTWIL